MASPAPIQVDVTNAARAPVKPAAVRSVLAAACSVAEISARLPEAPIVAVRITGDRELRALNRSYAGRDEVTDVLSFAGEDGHLGDIAISWASCERQGTEHGHGAEVELALLCVHGLLHLLGWDHLTATDRREMTRLTRLALRASKIEIARSRL